ncbi:MAG: SOS response-associated peptidase [Nitrosomonas sp.]|uniref:SOS response-associated peptidase n=1 Tax=Nitrosomonas sp. TaxID=42353 RepID=UPI0025D3EA05|nr:SOS response-associated peptidase [Nitrosomonas sp.]MBY0475448.1 SOS response-associated peptidase [Nitrosomonas sp.]
MCGRFVLSYPSSRLLEWYKAASMPEIQPAFNIAPMSPILVIRERFEGREGTFMRWGLVPRWAKDLKKIPLLNNARAETVAIKPIFKHAFRSQRCIIPATGFYEWKSPKDGKHRQPYYISTNEDGCPTSFAGIWDTVSINDTTIESCSIITTESNDLVRPIHDRMPALLPYESIDIWLKPDTLPEEMLDFFLKPYDSEKMQTWPVSTDVNKASNEGEQLIQPVNTES